jgi:hypothetical protein
MEGSGIAKKHDALLVAGAFERARAFMPMRAQMAYLCLA